MSDVVYMERQVFDDMMYVVRSLVQIIGTKELTSEEITRIKFATKVFQDHIKNSGDTKTR